MQTIERTAPIDKVLELAAAGETTLPRPAGLPQPGWYELRPYPRKRRPNKPRLHLFWRWRQDDGRLAARSIGRVN